MPCLTASKSVPIQLKVNGKSYSRTVEPRKLLVELLREDLDLTGRTWAATLLTAAHARC
jgi:aerobic-type carbon monoxide dehydrogenase small subunit (CoxS/CutS family)